MAIMTGESSLHPVFNPEDPIRALGWGGVGWRE